jgi:phosphatidate phosphatase PAH1
MIRKLSTSVTSILLAIICFNTQAARCPSADFLNNAPDYPVPEQSSFHIWANGWLSAWHRPYHMVHDKLVAHGRSATIVGKFDYDWAMHKDLEKEDVKVYLYGTGMSDWQYVGQYRTDSDGKIYVPIGVRNTGLYLVHMVVTGDLSTATGYLTVVEPGTQAVLFDIDGTLTLNDFESVGDYLGINTAAAYFYVPETVNTYIDKGYCIAYLSARPYWLMNDTREWLSEKSIPLWHVHTNPDAELFSKKDTAAYKLDYINQLKDNGLAIIRAYGNAESDIAAYADSGIPKAETYIIGEFAGDDNTQAIYDDYTYHYSTVVINTENAE